MDSGTALADSAARDTGLNFYRPQARVVALLFFAPIAYELWWYWQLFLFTRREGFPRARVFWWIIVPIYGWVVIYRQFDDLAEAAGESLPASRPAFSSTSAIWLVILSQLVGNASYRIAGVAASFVAFVVSDALIAGAGYLVQPAANGYLRRRYPEARPLPMTAGEIAAAVIGILFLAGEVLITFVWT